MFSTSEDGQVSSTNATYATARTGGTFALSAGAVQSRLGQDTGFTITESFLSFDTSTLTTDAIISSAVLSLVDQADISNANFVMEATLFDWGPTLATADYVSGASLGSLPLLATYDTTAGFTGTVYHDFTDVAMGSNVNPAGFTRMVLASDKLRLGTPPTAHEYRTFKTSEDDAGTTTDPKLVVVYIIPPPIVAPFGAVASRPSPVVRQG